MASDDGCSKFYQACGVDTEQRASMTCEEKKHGFVTACALGGGHPTDFCEALETELFLIADCEVLETDAAFCEALGDVLEAHRANQRSKAAAAAAQVLPEERKAEAARYLADVDAETIPTLVKILLGSAASLGVGVGAPSMLLQMNSRAGAAFAAL